MFLDLAVSIISSPDLPVLSPRTLFLPPCTISHPPLLFMDNTFVRTIARVREGLMDRRYAEKGLARRRLEEHGPVV